LRKILASFLRLSLDRFKMQRKGYETYDEMPLDIVDGPMLGTVKNFVLCKIDRVSLKWIWNG
jgi:hypothetical protein